MMKVILKSILERIVNLVKTPHDEWVKIASFVNDPVKTRREFFFPILYVMMGVIFVVQLFRLGDYPSFVLFLRDLVKSEVLVGVTTMVGLYLSVFVLTSLMSSAFFAGVEKDEKSVFSLIVYSSSILWSIQIVLILLPSLFFLNLLYLYTAYIIWEGVPVLFPSVGEDKRGRFAGVAFLLIIASNWMVEKLINTLIAL